MKIYKLIRNTDGYYFETKVMGYYKHFHQAQRKWMYLENDRVKLAQPVIDADHIGDHSDEARDASVTEYLIEVIEVDDRG